MRAKPGAEKRRMTALRKKRMKTNFKFGKKRRKKKGCYVATSVYGSYDCPEVWVLRRYRDTVLDNHIMGKLFIHSYYAISPLLVSLFGSFSWWNRLFKKRLDKLVVKLKAKGFSDTPYKDKM